MKFKTILADPPWPYDGGGPVGNGGRGSQGGNAKKIVQVDATNHYPLLDVESMSLLRVSDLAEDNAHMYLWTTNSFLVEAHELMRAWGFEPKTLLTWAKLKKGSNDEPSMKTGYYFRSATEHILFGVRGSLRLMGPCRPTVFFAERLPHSVKPEESYQLIEEQSPRPRLEMFARRRREGWAVWGNEVESDVVIDA